MLFTHAEALGHRVRLIRPVRQFPANDDFLLLSTGRPVLAQFAPAWTPTFGPDSNRISAVPSWRPGRIMQRACDRRPQACAHEPKSGRGPQAADSGDDVTDRLLAFLSERLLMLSIHTRSWELQLCLLIPRGRLDRARYGGCRYRRPACKQKRGAPQGGRYRRNYRRRRR
jgi:hypothetical protein